MTECANCGAALQGPFCYQCGQKASHIDVGVRDFAHQAIHEFLHLDGKIFQTLKILILKPGELTLEYFRGRRARYISPVRLYLTCSVLYFAISALSPASLGNWRVTSTDLAAPGSAEAIRHVQEAMNVLQDRMSHYAPRAMFVLMPVFALLTWGFFRRAQPYYVPHLYYAVHFHAFVFLALAAAKVAHFIGPIGVVTDPLLTVLVIAYHFAAIQRVFGRTRGEVAWKGSMIAVIYCSILGAIVGSAFLYYLVPIMRNVSHSS